VPHVDLSGVEVTVFGRAKKGRRGRAARAAAQQSYLQVMIPKLTGCSQAVAAIGALVQQSRWDDVAWRHELERQAAALQTLHGELAEVKGIPQGLRQAHGAILDASRSLEEAFALLAARGDEGPGDWPALMALVAGAAEDLDRCVELLSTGLARLT